MNRSGMPFPLPVVPPKFTSRTAAAQSRRFAAQLYADFFAFPISRARRVLEKTSAEEWEKEGQKRALQVFHAAAERVPAYKDFLKKHKIRHAKVKSIAEFQHVPWVDKDNYLRQYSLEELCWDGVLSTTQTTSVSSGSSGQPFLWPRGILLELETTYLFELFMSSIFAADTTSTLLVNSQSMGMYIGGPFTLNAMLRIAQKGSPINVVTPGITIEDVMQVISQMKDNYDQLVIAAYPPFAKDIVDIGIERGINWAEIPTKFILFGESFSEPWREYMSELVGGINPTTSFINCFGTADAAILGHETPYTISLRHTLAKNPSLFKGLFGEERLPALMQYYPTLRYLELVDKELALTFGSGGLPLVRYNIHDRGGIIPYSRSAELFAAEPDSIVAAGTWRLPLVYVFGKSDFTATLYGLNVYPENIKAALMHPDIRGFVSGKFQMSTEYRRHTHNQYLLIRIELAPRVRATTPVRSSIRQVLIETLEQNNAEYRKLHESIGKRAVPDIRLHPWGDTRYFPMGKKQHGAGLKISEHASIRK